MEAENTVSAAMDWLFKWVQEIQDAVDKCEPRVVDCEELPPSKDDPWGHPNFIDVNPYIPGLADVLKLVKPIHERLSEYSTDKSIPASTYEQLTSLYLLLRKLKRYETRPHLISAEVLDAVSRSAMELYVAVCRYKKGQSSQNSSSDNALS